MAEVDVHGPYGPTPRSPERAENSTEVPRLRMRQRLARLGAGRSPRATVLDPLFQMIRAHHPRMDLGMIERAYDTAEFYHRGQLRKSGDPYITHPLAVTTILAELGMTEATLCAALLHDTVEDTSYTGAQLTSDFGEEIARLVDGVTKLDKFTYGDAAKAETLRKMVVAMAKDIRVLVIKLADRLHNMRTLHYLRVDKQQRIAEETLQIFAPLAHRLGMNTIKWELEDLAFSAMHPKLYDEIVRMVATRTPAREEFLRTVINQVQEDLREAKIKSTVYGRPKHYYSIYQKMVNRGREFDNIYDLVGLRILVDTPRDCYAALGVMHVRWNPLPGRFKDYIAMPKFNLYQSLHTTVLGPEGRPVELQIRTHDMHRAAEYGVAAHWKYKQGNDVADLNWVARLLEWQRESEDPEEFMDDLRFEVQSSEVYVYTPKGEVMALPTGSTPVDFAYAVHTHVGDACIGGRVNGRLVPLDAELKSGDSVEVLTSKAENAGPSRDWLKFVKSTRAKNKIKHYFNRERREEAIESGKELLHKQLKRDGLAPQRVLTAANLIEAAESLGIQGVSGLYAAIGEGGVSASAVVQRVIAAEGGAEAVTDDVREEQPVLITSRRHADWDEAIQVEGEADMLFKLARCCTPVPGDEILGFVTRASGVSVHRTNCPNVPELQNQAERIIAVSWSQETPGGSFLVGIQVEGLDRAGLLADVTRVVADHHVNILSADMSASQERIFKVRITFETADHTHLKHLMTNLKKISGVYDVFRLRQ